MNTSNNIIDIKLSVNTINQILGYLGTRPYQEVFQMIQAIQKEAEEKKAEDGNSGD